jgi:tRNA (cytidine/uridine-2'-O-)-methyltransferase
MLDIVLYQPEIPPNTGNIIRLCANTGFRLHLIEPLGFEFQSLQVHPTWPSYVNKIKPKNVYGLSTKGMISYSSMTYQPGDTLLFGPETRGLPDDIRSSIGVENILRLPMLSNSRSLNLSNTVAIVAYEAWRQLGFIGSIK